MLPFIRLVPWRASLGVAWFFLSASVNAQLGDDPAAEPPPARGGALSEQVAEPSVTSEDRKMHELKARADTLFRAREYIEAVALYDQAHALVADPRLLYNKGRALQALGRYATAFDVFRQFRTAAPLELKEQLPGLDALIDGLRQKLSEVRIEVNVPGAKVTLGSEGLGRSPLSGARLVPAGRVRLRVEKQGYFPVEREVFLEGGGSASFVVSLESTAQYAKLLVQSRVPGTHVQVGDQQLGLAPTEVVLTPGSHQVLARREGYNEASTRVVLDVGQQRSITLDPLRAPAFYERWWFWGGVGVAGVIVVGAVVLSSRSPTETEGNFSPSAIGAPLVAF